MTASDEGPPVTGTDRVPAPARRVGAVLGAPQSWPWLSGADFSVGFVRRVGRRAFHRADDAAGSGPVYFAVEHDGRAGALWLVDGEDGTASGPATLTWTVDDLPDGTSGVHTTGHDQLPAVLRDIWTRPAFADTLGAYSAEVDRACGHTDPLGAARALAPMLRARAADSEAAGTLDIGCVTALREAGLFRLGPPDDLGGTDPRPEVVVDTIAELGRADAAAGWCTFIGNQSAYTAWLDDAVRAELAGADGGLILAGSTAVSGTAEPSTADTVTVSGRWRFNSGCLHADWLMGGVTVPGADGPEPRLAFVPPDAATIPATWHVAGLTGTGSHDLVLDRVPVPRRRLAPLFTEPAGSGRTLHRLSPYNIQAVLMVGLPLGIARRALDEAAPAASGDATAAVELAALETELAAARALAHDTVADHWTELAGAGTLSTPSGARLALVLRHTVDTAKRVTSGAMRMAGPWTTAPGHEALRRCLRDAFAAGQHLAVSDDVYARNAARLLDTAA